MRKRSRAILFLVLPTLLFTACVTVQELPTTSPISSPMPTATLSKTESIPTTRQALEAMYGNKALSISDTEAILPAPVSYYTTTVHINLMACFWEDLAEKCLVITDSAFGHCHACQADIGGAVFQRVNGSWKHVVFRPNIISLGSFGYVPKGELIQIGPDKHAALLRSGWAGQGYEGQYTIIIAEIDGNLRVVLNLRVSEMQETFAKDGTTFLAWGYSSNLEFFPGEHPDFYDLVVTQYGVNRDGDKFKTVSFYTFSEENHEYALVRQW